jgi:hypothetical protein
MTRVLAGPDQGTGTYDPLKTPYEVDASGFPRDGFLEDQFAFMVRYAILAPSSHNTQPWKFDVNEHGIWVYADYTRRLPVADPGSRELLMSVGAAIMNLRIAAAHFGFGCDVEYNYTGDSELPLAFVRLNTAAGSSPHGRSLSALFPAITRRHTNRNPFLAARVPDRVITSLYAQAALHQAAVFVSTDGSLNLSVANLVAAADRYQQADPLFRKELAEWVRSNWTHEGDGMTGEAFGVKGVASLLGAWATRNFNLGHTQAAKDKALCAEAPCLAVIYGEDTTPMLLEAGELLQRIFLSITLEGLHVSFFNMPIQVPELRTQLRKMLGIPSWPQLLLRIGFCLTPPANAPRRPIHEVLMNQPRSER